METVKNLPEEPGIYKFFNKKNQLIYVGKAKNLKKRVSSYFTNKSGTSLKTKKLVSEITHIEYSVTETEYNALLLENNLIKENSPKYNILLKDDKTFPFICILKEPFPRIISTRKHTPERGEFYGPYTSIAAMKSVLYLIRKLYTIRTCNYNLNDKNINNNKYKVCLEYHINNCLGPCEKKQSELEYNSEIEHARNILRGKMSVVKEYYKTIMKEASDNLQFEIAQNIKDKLNLIEKFHAKSIVVSTKITNLDGITIISDKKTAWINFFQIQQGAMIITRNIEITKRYEETDIEVISKSYEYFKILTNSKSYDIISNINFTYNESGENITVPKIGDKKKLIELSIKNALEFKKNKILNKEPKKSPILLQLQSDLNLKEYPEVIECFDNSNIQGTTPVASMVSFIKGKPSKSNYRKYNIKTVEGPNDFASMEEVVYRRYKRLKEEGGVIPNLVVIDGGKGQLSSAVKSLKKLNMYNDIPIIGIAKRLEEIYFPEDSYPLYLNKKSGSLKLIQQLRDEAHRFAITFHRQKRSKNTFNLEYYNIKGIGPTTIKTLIKEFKSVKNISEADKPKLQKIIGNSKTEKLLDYLKKNKAT